MSITAAAIIPAGGIGRRMGLPQPKQFSILAGLPLIVHTIRAFHETAVVREIILVVPEEHLHFAEELVARHRLSRVRKVVAGGRLRQDSVAAGLAQVSDDCQCVLVHDGARPLIDPALIEECAERAYEFGAAMLAVPVKDTLKAVDSSLQIQGTVDREGMWQAQTPQAARLDLMRQAFAAASRDGFNGTDEASLLERIAVPVMVVEGSERNIKITRPDDLEIAEALLKEQRRGERDMTGSMRIGHGYDAHRLVADRPLVLGGVTINHPKGLLGHSDADVLTHALCDAVLGALAEGDIGRHFPDTDQRFKGISSLTLLAQVMAIAESRGYRLLNADITVVAERPKLSPYYPKMLENLASVCKVEQSAINLKASTTEKMGFAGREEGIAAHAMVLLQRENA